MAGTLRCPRCGAPARPPGPWTADWTCAEHGTVAPLHPFPVPSAEGVRRLAEASSVPVWLPWPLPEGWVVSGHGWAGDDANGPLATVLAASGPNPVGGAADLIVVAERPGVGLGSAYAGLAGADPGDGAGRTAPHARADVGGHSAALWSVDAPPDRAAYVGEAAACWLWLVLRPATAGHLLVEGLRLADLRDLGDELDVAPFGALTPALRI